MTPQTNTTEPPPILATPFDPSKLNIAVALSLTLPGTSTIVAALLFKGVIENGIKSRINTPFNSGVRLFRSDIPKPALTTTHILEGVVWFANFDSISYTHSTHDAGMRAGSLVLRAIKDAIESAMVSEFCDVAYWDVREEIWFSLSERVLCRFEGVFASEGQEASNASFLKEKELHDARIARWKSILDQLQRNPNAG